MQDNPFVDFEQPITSADLDAVEQRFGFAFPRELRAHYLNYNGGCPTKYLFAKDDRVHVVQQFLALRYGADTFEQTFEDLKVAGAILPAHLVPFAIDRVAIIFALVRILIPRARSLFSLVSTLIAQRMRCSF